MMRLPRSFERVYGLCAENNASWTIMEGQLRHCRSDNSEASHSGYAEQYMDMHNQLN